ncbi:MULTISPECIES: hypothetical protein [unclassified Pseudomonas]|uniref:hypothetical protein n=1 Tax=unclassified Pseudomonas TaxID=196821 RepID=UPI00244BF196|nr:MULTISPECIES: hypothetical protein [unclassified Pseudomonas]MDH0302156.1 hypothetical protein [Pseudomonas sp. GD04091]MDH1987973.1 hypothetical protein [Pseudomonas sp. GD03689]
MGIVSVTVDEVNAIDINIDDIVYLESNDDGTSQIYTGTQPHGWNLDKKNTEAVKSKLGIKKQ